jgi:Domain of unknown function (DUF1840)
VIRFHSKAGADVLMLQPHADAVLRALGREPAPQGIFEAASIPEALAAFAARTPDLPPTDDEAAATEDVPDLGRRAWPLLQLLRRARDASVVLTWSSS